MKNLCIVPCGSKKIWSKNPEAGPAKARNAYIGPFARKCQEYAEKFYPNSWCILSAKYGFLLPDDVVPGPYNVSFKDKVTNPISLKDLLKQAKEKKLNKYERVIVLGGKNYVKIVEQVFIRKAVLNPLSGCKGIGYMMSRLNDAVSAHCNLLSRLER